MTKRKTMKDSPLKDFAALLGKEVGEARKFLTDNRIEFNGFRVKVLRTISIDGIGQNLTMSYNANRINVDVVGGKVSKVDYIG